MFFRTVFLVCVLVFGATQLAFSAESISVYRVEIINQSERPIVVDWMKLKCVSKVANLYPNFVDARQSRTYTLHLDPSCSFPLRHAEIHVTADELYSGKIEFLPRNGGFQPAILTQNKHHLKIILAPAHLAKISYTPVEY